MDLSHEVRGSGRTRRAGLAAVVLGSAIGVGSMSGCGAALLAGVGYAAAEEIGQSNVEAAQILAGNNGQKRQTESKSVEQMAFESWTRRQSREPKVFACNYIDNSLDGDTSSVSEQDVIGRRTDLPALFRDDEPICFSGFTLGDYLGKKSAFKLVNESGSTIYANEGIIDHSDGCFGAVWYRPGELAAGDYKFVWYLDDTFVGSVDARVMSSSSVLTQK